MNLTRRSFLAGSAAVAGSHAIAPPLRISVSRDIADPASGSEQEPGRIVIPSTMPMGSGAPLGGIGTGFVEIRPDGCFHEWQIFNAGPWAQHVPSTTAPPATGPQYLRLMIRVGAGSDRPPQLRRLYLRSDENNLYTLPFAQDVEGIDYLASFPVTGLEYHDASLPVRVSSEIFSPFVPGKARDSATPGFHVVFTLKNASNTPIEASIAGFLDNPLASALPDRRLTNTLVQDPGCTRLFLDTAAHADFPSGIGNLCLSVAGGQSSFVTGTFQEYAAPGTCRWQTPRVNYMLLSVLQEYLASGALPNAAASQDPSTSLPSASDLEGLSPEAARHLIESLSSDALLRRVFTDARLAAPEGGATDKELLQEVRHNLIGSDGKPRLTWGTGALASSVRLAPGAHAEICFTLSWYFPHHLTAEKREMGHMYSAWYQNALDVNRYLTYNYAAHRTATFAFARALADTSLGSPLAFAWSSQLSSLISNTWWTRDGSYAIWEGLGCCGLSTTDVDYQGSFPTVALFPELKLSQMLQTIQHQNEQGQVPHNYPGDVSRVDDGFARVDLNPQFVMMVWRDYVWTGDRQYIEKMAPHVIRAMNFTQSLDANGDGLPDRQTAIQSYDQWRMRGTPSYVASLWIGALKAAIPIATELGMHDQAQRWTGTLQAASASFDRMLFNGEYYSLWVDGALRSELCMTDQLSGEWFTRMIGLPATISAANLARAIDNIFRNNFNPEFGLHNATAPRRGPELLALNNLQAGGLWSGIEFAFASFLMASGRYDEGVRVVEAVHRRYLRAGQPWNHVECGGHYSRAMSSWATLLSATGFVPDVSSATLTLVPAVPGDFRAPWVMSSGFGTIARSGRALSLGCSYGKLQVRSLRLATVPTRIHISGEARKFRAATDGTLTRVTFDQPLTLAADQVLVIE
ncbi:MAG TPA: GH116 family glycosyl hydrolase [Acidobacteriaceae bacterium]|nr:GH116 family glycosyl hydrolase [Acidobacteriaceae bacterium]